MLLCDHQQNTLYRQDTGLKVKEPAPIKIKGPYKIPVSRKVEFIKLKMINNLDFDIIRWSETHINLDLFLLWQEAGKQDSPATGF